MKMVVGRVAVLIVLAFNVTCGPGGNAGAGGSGGSGGSGGTGGSGGSGGVDCSTLPTVTLAVSSPLPTELGSGCAQGDVTELDALLFLSKNAPCATTINCTLIANGAGASDSCADVPSNENYTIDLTYRALDSSNFPRPVALQSKYVELPANSADPFPLSFAGVALESFYQANLTAWCNGSL